MAGTKRLTIKLQDSPMKLFVAKSNYLGSLKVHSVFSM